MTAPVPIAASLSIAETPTESKNQGGKADPTVVRDDERDDFERRRAEWRPYYRLVGTDDRLCFDRMVLFSIRVERCQAREAELRRFERMRAETHWETDRRAEAEALARGLPRRPALIASRLQQTSQGVECLLARWDLLAGLLKTQGKWNVRQTAMALDLIGTPRELRPEKPEVDDPAALVAGEVARLRGLKARSLDRLDRMERDAARAGTPISTSAEMRRLQREEAACLRQYLKAAAQLRELRVTPPQAPSPEPESQPKAGPIRRDTGNEVADATPLVRVPLAATGKHGDLPGVPTIASGARHPGSY